MSKNKIFGLAFLAVIIAGLGIISLSVQSGSSVAEEASSIEADTDKLYDIEEVLSERALGDENAPITLIEFASLSCSHCATFHNNVYPKLKENYIDTGKVRFIFSDYPLNAPAMDGSVAARCLPKDRYFKFIKFLFATQEEWAYSSTPQKYILQNAKLLGGDGDKLAACLGSDDIRQGLVTSMQLANKVYGINSTPSFRANDKALPGTRTYEEFSASLDKLLEESTATE